MSQPLAPPNQPAGRPPARPSPSPPARPSPAPQPARPAARIPARPPEREPALLRTKAELAAARLGLPAPVVLVPTMGALHAGHRALLRAARAAAGPAGSVIVSIFVNPLQFRPGEDLDRYPRSLDDDLAMCAQEGVRAVFAPSAAEMYPGGPPQVTVDPGPAGQVFEGEFRPGFFGGVLTVVLKLFHLVRPDVAVFGEKDAQQLALVRRLVVDTDLGLAIEAVPTVRDPDGLATSSRNRYLSAADRELALTLPRALRAGQARAAASRRCRRECTQRRRRPGRRPGGPARRARAGGGLRRGGRSAHVRTGRARARADRGRGRRGRHAADRQRAGRADRRPEHGKGFPRCC